MSENNIFLRIFCQIPDATEGEKKKEKKDRYPIEEASAILHFYRADRRVSVNLSVSFFFFQGRWRTTLKKNDVAINRAV